MKKIFLITAVFLNLLFLSSCDKELELNNPNTLTTGQYWATESDAQAGINSVYAMFYKDGMWQR
jgi:hypothetical protein